MSENESYKIRFFHGVTERNDPIYSYKEIAHADYVVITESLCFLQLCRDRKKAYDHFVSNYRDYEFSNFSTILDHVLMSSDRQHFLLARNSIDRQVSNLLSATYLYLTLHRIKRKNNKIDDYSFENSKDLPSIYALKKYFKELTNEYHRKHYQYTFISALRNKINHGGSLEKSTWLGGEWSLQFESIGSDEDHGVWKKDKRYSIFDQEILKEDARKIIDNADHYATVQDMVPQKFYLREAMRRYVDLLSTVHAKVSNDNEDQINTSRSVINSALDHTEEYIHASLVTCNESVVSPMGSQIEEIYQFFETAKSPLYLEHYAMPGEPSAVPKNL